MFTVQTRLNSARVDLARIVDFSWHLISTDSDNETCLIKMK